MEVAGLFLKLGLTSFGGPAVHIAMMEEETVRRRKWLSRDEFLDRLGASNLIPGPTSTELSMHLGYVRAGVPGLWIAGLCFILPAFLIVSGLAWALYGVKPVVAVVVAQALWKLGQTALKTKYLVLLAVLSAILVYLQWNALLVLALAGLAATLPRLKGQGKSLGAFGILGTAGSSLIPTVTFSSLFFFFLKVGFVLFGSGYVLLAFLQTDLVDHWHWLTQQQLLDTIAVGQATPGPVIATIGIFLPAFVLVALSGWMVPQIRRHPAVGAALDGINAASLALMALVTFQMGRASLTELPTLLIAGVAAYFVFRTRLNSVWIIAGGALAGWVINRVLKKYFSEPCRQPWDRTSH